MNISHFFNSGLKISQIRPNAQSSTMRSILNETQTLSGSKSQKIAVFDFDGTIFPNDIGKMVREYFSKHPKSEFAEGLDFENLWDELDEKGEDFAPYQTKLLAGYSQPEIDYIVQREFFPEGLPLFTEVMALIEELKEQGVKVYIVSASPQPILRALSKIIDLPREQILGTDLKLSSNGKYLAEIRGPISNGPQKVDKVLAEVPSDSKIILAVGNTNWDRELIKMAAIGLVIRTADFTHHHYLSEITLSQVAVLRNWRRYYPDLISYFKIAP